MDYVAEVWQKLSSELAALQDSGAKSDYSRPVYNHFTDRQVGDYRIRTHSEDHFVLNPVSGYPAIFDTALAAKVFFEQYKITGEKKWKKRYTGAEEIVQSFNPYSGLHELKWDPVDWWWDEKSIFPTGVVLSSIWTLDNKDLSEIPPVKIEKLRDYLSKLQYETDKFSHYILPEGEIPSDVLNTTAMGLYLRTVVDQNSRGTENNLKGSIDSSARHIQTSQRPDGFWPYTHSGSLQNELFSIDRLRPLLRHRLLRRTIFRGSRSIFYGDTTHHCMVLYYLIKSHFITDSLNLENSIINGWEFIRNKICWSEGQAHFDYSWIQEPQRTEFTAKYDTTSYFYIMSLLPKLKKLRIISKRELKKLAQGLMRYLYKNNLSADFPCIKPHDCEYRLRRKILPAIWWSSSLKGALLSEYMAYQ